MYTQLQQELFNRRFHGTSNLKGIDFQILYALYTSLDLLASEAGLEKVTLEGIEDIDLKPFKADNIYLQVKTSVNSWHLSDIASPLINFINLNRNSENPQKFKLIINFEPRISISNLLSNEVILQDKENLIKDILTYKEIKDNAITREQIISVISNCEVIHINRANLFKETKNKIHTLLEIQPIETENFLLSFLYKFIDWSIERKTIDKTDILNFKVRYSENKERSKEFEAFGKGLIDRISWQKENQSSDYFEGKKTRSGHIALGLDVRRPKWLDKINEFFKKTNVCVIREASGQGKSTLAFRYALDYWNPDYTFIIRLVETGEHAELISNYLKSLSELGFSVSVLIDDINQERKYFSKILLNCANHQISFLITSRNDDFESFANVGQVSIKFIFPQFDRHEAQLIFQNLNREKRIHSNAISSDWAFERISSPKCLIEFIFLITQGEMLYERLSQQIRDMRANNQVEKIDLLRKIIIADVCQTPLNINQLLLNDSLGVDYQGILKDMKNEFIIIEDDYIKGYHWVRSSHLLKILHEDYANPAISAIKTLPLIDKDKLSVFIGNLIEIPNFDSSTLINNFKLVTIQTDITSYLSFISGIFKIGEFQFFLTNKEIYDEGYEKFNEGVLLLFNSLVLPTKSINLFGIFGENKSFKEAEDLSKKFKQSIRGFDLVKAFTEANTFNFDVISESLEFTGQVLDWSYWINSNLINLNKLDELIKNPKVLELEINSFSLFSQALYRKYPQKHKKWFNDNRRKIIKKLENILQCSISLNSESVSIKYKQIINGESFNDSTVRRLNVLRSSIPFCKKYRVYHTIMHIFAMFAKLKYKHAYDQSYEDIPSESLHFKSDVEKNKVLNDIVESYYKVKTWYEFASYYYKLRQEIIIYSENICKKLNGIATNFKGLDAPYISDKILHSSKKLPVEIELIQKPFNDCMDAFNSFNNFLIMKSNFVQNELDEEAKRLLFIHYNNFLIKLPKMQEFFTLLKGFAPDYFPFEDLNLKEIKIFNHLKDLLKINIPNSKTYWDFNTNID